MQAHLNRESDRTRIGLFGDFVIDCFLHLTGRNHGPFGTRKGTHDLIADGFDQRAVLTLDHGGQQLQTGGDLRACRFITQHFIYPRATADIREYDGEGAGLQCHGP